MDIPDDLIANLSTTTGPVLIYFRAGIPEYGFALRSDEFVTNLAMFTEALKMAGLYTLE